jgi:hypothetical protein
MKKIIFFISLLIFSSFAFAQHTVVMKNGTKLTGKVLSMNDGVLQLSSNQTINKINVSEISVVVFVDATTEKTETAAAAAEPGEKNMTAGSYFVRYKVADRTIVKAPRIDNLTQRKGTVKVNVSINKYGNVVKAVPGAPGSTTTDEYLFTKAKQAAESAFFDNVPTAPLEQTGYIIITF